MTRLCYKHWANINKNGISCLICGKILMPFLCIYYETISVSFTKCSLTSVPPLGQCILSSLKCYRVNLALQRIFLKSLKFNLPNMRPKNVSFIIKYNATKFFFKWKVLWNNSVIILIFFYRAHYYFCWGCRRNKRYLIKLRGNKTSRRIIYQNSQQICLT